MSAAGLLGPYLVGKKIAARIWPVMGKGSFFDAGIMVGSGDSFQERFAVSEIALRRLLPVCCLTAISVPSGVVVMISG